MYKAIHYFTDLQDNNHPYNAGDRFPRVGLDVTEERLAELTGSKNKRGLPLIRRVDEEPDAEPKEGKPEKEAEQKEEDKPKRAAKRNRTTK